MNTSFDYGKKLPDGQFERHPVLFVENDAEFIRPLRYSYKHLKCGNITTMGSKIARTYASKPDFYNGTFCSNCRDYFSFSSEDGKFVWVNIDGKVSTEEVGK